MPTKLRRFCWCYIDKNRYQGEYYFPVLGKFYSGETFGLDYSYEADYKELKKTFQEEENLKPTQKKIGYYYLSFPTLLMKTILSI